VKCEVDNRWARSSDQLPHGLQRQSDLAEPYFSSLLLNSVGQEMNYRFVKFRWHRMRDYKLYQKAIILVLFLSFCSGWYEVAELTEPIDSWI
jgi:hypothetical protein